MSKQRLLHIGYPKCMSTSLQKDFFAKHPEVYFLGCGRPDTEHGWISDEMAGIGEVSLRYAKEFMFDVAETRQRMEKYLQEFENDESRKLLCFSSESMSFTMHFDIDAAAKARRLRDLFGQDCKVLMVIRNQLGLFRSYYFECVRSGYPGFFGEFVEFNYYHLFRSILSDLFYDRMYNLYCELFGRDNVKVVPMETLVNYKETTMRELCLFFGVTPVDLELTKHNDSDDKSYLQAVRVLNEKFPNNMGNTYYRMTDTEKLTGYWTRILGMEVPESAKKNYADRMMVYRAAKSTFKDFVDPISAEYPDNWKERLEKLFAPHNSSLASRTGLDLRALGYPHILR